MEGVKQDQRKILGLGELVWAYLGWEGGVHSVQQFGPLKRYSGKSPTGNGHKEDMSLSGKIFLRREQSSQALKVKENPWACL